MKTRLLCVTFLLLSVLAGFGAPPRSALWVKVDEAEKQGLPKTAIERLEPIIANALSEHAYAEAIRAIGRRIYLEGEIEGAGAEPKIVRLQVELEKAPAEMKPLMEALLAHWYWQYFQENRWDITQRTQTAAAPGADLRTWDLPRILAEIDRHFTAALANETLLQSTPVADYDALLDRGNVPDAYRPTLFDFVAHEALKFYQAGEHGVQIAEDEFEIEATSPIFDDAVALAQWKPDTAESNSPRLKAIGLYQQLLGFHEKDADRAAYFDAELSRLVYAHNVGFGDEKDARYKVALRRLLELPAVPREIATRAYAALAAQLQSESELVDARKVAQRGVDLAPDTAGAAQCANLIQQITAPSAQLTTEHVWNAPWPTLDVTYRNVTKVYFRAIPVNFERLLSESRWGMSAGANDQTRQLLNTRPALEWTADLPATDDLKDRTEHLPAPTSLARGCYLIAASYSPTFSKGDNQVSVATVWVSRLAMVIRLHTDGEHQSAFVLDAVTGEPLKGATVKRWQRDREGWIKSIPSVTTDANGQFSLPKSDGATFALAEFNGESVASLHELYAYRNEEQEKADWRTVFFTDRAIYRPGQTVSYKGICVAYDRAAGKYSAEASRRLTVVFQDPNGQEVARATHTTNEYGSFNGVFIAPRDRLMGVMSLRVLDRPDQANIRVEEYKRPKFHVALEAPKDAAKLGGAPVRVTGSATAYTGVGIGGAKVKWRVERGARFPSWCWWWQPPAIKAIAHGSGVTAADGTFQIEFTAVPDRAIPAKTEPVFIYRVHADITDTTGETRSVTREVRAGYTALQATVTADGWQTSDKPVELDVLTTSLDGDAQSASGTLTIHALVQPKAVTRALLQAGRYSWWSRAEEPPADPTNADSWSLGEKVAEEAFKTDATGKRHLLSPLKAGIYRVSLETSDRFGQKVTARYTLQVQEPRSDHYALKLPNHFAIPKGAFEPGETFTALWGTGYATGRALVELECAGKSLQRYWTPADRTQALVELPVTEAMRGGFTVRVTFVRENRAYFNEQVVNVPWTNKELSVKWERFRSKLLPGEKETWTAVVSGPKAKRASAEMVATLYDASLDQFVPHTWLTGFDIFRTEQMRGQSEFQNAARSFQLLYSWEHPAHRDVSWRYRKFPSEVIGYGANNEAVVLMPFSVSVGSAGGYKARGSLAGSRIHTQLMDKGIQASMPAVMGPSDVNAAYIEEAVAQSGNSPAAAPKPDLSKVSARKNLNETAFFFPQLISDDDGVVKMVFTMPEALTEWKFMGFAHDRQLRSGLIADKVVTSKDLMVAPNPPRFLREGDAIEFTVKVSNRSDAPQSGTVRLTFADAATLSSVDEALANRVTEQSFEIPANQSRSFSWRIAVPDGLGFVNYKAVAATAKFSDGEEGIVPVLSRRVLVTESLPLPIRGAGTKAFEFTKLAESRASSTLRHQSLTVQMTSQPAWYAVMALPYLMEFPYECSEQVFNRYYANALARHIANSDPKIRRVFDLWKNTSALESPLEKNQELKSVMLEETPWMRAAKPESQARKNVGLLFDANRLNEESARVLRVLGDRQGSDGLWSWFPGGPSSEYISLYLVAGFGRLRHLGVEGDVQAGVKALAALDTWMEKNHREILKRQRPEDYVPGSTEALYLYARSFYLEDQPVAPPHAEAIAFYLRQARTHWMKIGSRQSQAHLALALHRFGDKAGAEAIVNSLKERSATSEELGMYWADSKNSWWWYDAPIETQAMMIELFAEVGDDAEAVEACKVWLLKQKQTQDWRTTKATADAIYSLLVQGDKLLASDAVVEVALGGESIKPEKVEAGTGFYEKKFSGSEIKPAMGHVTVTKADQGVSWGSVHWQYLEDVAKVTPHTGTPLQLKKTLWVKETTSKGQVLKPVSGPLAVGDELVVRLELRTDRDMEFVHLKDQRGSGTEPVNVLSQYRYQDGLGYYESTRDTASHYFIDYLPKGVYVFEYSTRVQLRGSYQSGLAEIQCMYAPEFNSHSESVPIEVK